MSHADNNKTCTVCLKTKPATLEYFIRKRAGYPALRARCKQCTEEHCYKNGGDVRQELHGKCHSHRREYRAWIKMKARCLNSDDPAYHYYGGRGITMHLSWIKSFSQFLSDVGRCPAGYSLDRIDNEGGYEPTNVRWTTHKVQMNNMRRNRLVTILGVTKTLSNWARDIGISVDGLASRLAHNWPEEDLRKPTWSVPRHRKQGG